MSSAIDLHLHSRASDGDDTPAQLADRCAAAGLGTVALTDHNTVRNLAAAAAGFAARDIDFVPGCELSTRWRGAEHHLLALWVDSSDARFAARIERIRQADLARSRTWVERAQADGNRISWDAVVAEVGPDRVPPFAVIASQLQQGLRPGSAAAARRDHRNGLWDDFAPGRPYGASAPFQPSLPEAVGWVRENGAVPVLAHPGRSFPAAADFEEILATLRDAGLAGVECWTPHHRDEDAQRFAEIAGSLGLLVSAGADYHGPTVKPWVRAPGQVSHNTADLVDALAAQRRPLRRSAGDARHRTE